MENGQMIFTHVLKMEEYVLKTDWYNYFFRTYCILKELIEAGCILSIPSNKKDMEVLKKLLWYILYTKNSFVYLYFRNTNRNPLFWKLFHDYGITRYPEFIKDNINNFIHDDVFCKSWLDKMWSAPLLLMKTMNNHATYRRLLQFIDESHNIERLCLLIRDGKFIMACMTHPTTSPKTKKLLCLLLQATCQTDMYYRVLYEYLKLDIIDTVYTLFIQEYMTPLVTEHDRIDDMKRLINGEIVSSCSELYELYQFRNTHKHFFT